MRINSGNVIRTGLTIAILAGAATWGVGSAEKSFIDNPETIRAALSWVAEGIAFVTRAENPHYRPMEQILYEGIQQYETETNSKAFYKRDPSFKNYDYYKRALNKTLNQNLLPLSPSDLAKTVEDLLPETARQEYLSSDTAFGDFHSIFVEGSGLWARFLKETLANDPSKRIDEMKTKGKEYLSEAKKFVEDEVKKNSDHPVSASHIFAFFLEKNNGDITQSISDTAIFLKFASRNDFETGDFSANERNDKWMRENILDESAGQPYDKMPPDQENLNDRINREGIYHSWDLVAKLRALPWQLVDQGGLYRQLTHITQQGLDKLEADLVTLGNLENTEIYLLSYTQH